MVACHEEVHSFLVREKGILGWGQGNKEPSGKSGLKLRKGVFNNKPLMMKDFRVEAEKILMETMDGWRGETEWDYIISAPNTNSVLAFHL